MLSNSPTQPAHPISKPAVALSVYDPSIPESPQQMAPHVFTSCACRTAHFRMPLYQYWCEQLAETMARFHRKQWEFVYICQALFERGMLVPGKSAIGFGVGKEPLVSAFAKRGVQVLASDLDLERAQKAGWVNTHQHSNSLASLNERNLCPAREFEKLVTFRTIDMNEIPSDLPKVDFCYSSCSLEHLGSIKLGLEFIHNTLKLLKPGGIAIHTTEYNVNSNTDTLDNHPSLVVFRRRDIEEFAAKVSAEGYIVAPIDFDTGTDKHETYVDTPPYSEDFHLKLLLIEKYVSTSIGLIIQAPTQ